MQLNPMRVMPAEAHYQGSSSLSVDYAVDVSHQLDRPLNGPHGKASAGRYVAATSKPIRQSMLG